MPPNSGLTISSWLSDKELLLTSGTFWKTFFILLVSFSKAFLRDFVFTVFSVCFGVVAIVLFPLDYRLSILRVSEPQDNLFCLAVIFDGTAGVIFTILTTDDFS